MNKTQALKKFNDDYQSFKEGEKNNFSRIVNKMLQINFLTRKKSGDNNDFRFILAYEEAFKAFFILMDFELNIHREDEVIYIRNLEKFNHINLRKTESVLTLVLRIIFQRKQDIVTLDDDVEVYLYEIHDELQRINYLDNKRITKNELKPALSFLRSYNIIDYIDRGLSDDARIKIYPTILYVTNLDGIKEVIEKLESYTEGGIMDEETYQN